MGEPRVLNKRAARKVNDFFYLHIFTVCANTIYHNKEERCVMPTVLDRIATISASEELSATDKVSEFEKIASKYKVSRIELMDALVAIAPPAQSNGRLSADDTSALLRAINSLGSVAINANDPELLPLATDGIVKIRQGMIGRIDQSALQRYSSTLGTVNDDPSYPP